MAATSPFVNTDHGMPYFMHAKVNKQLLTQNCWTVKQNPISLLLLRRSVDPSEIMRILSGDHADTFRRR
jgi:hypothetical protein